MTRFLLALTPLVTSCTFPRWLQFRAGAERELASKTTGFNTESDSFLSGIVLNGNRLTSGTPHCSLYSIQTNHFRHGARGGSAKCASAAVSSSSALLLLWSRMKRTGKVTRNGAEKPRCARDGLIRQTLVIKLETFGSADVSAETRCG